MPKDREKLQENEELDLTWLEDLSAEPPLVPVIPFNSKNKHGQNKQIKYQGNGWKYYLSIKNKLPAWWDEFNGKVNKTTAPAYKNIWSFIKTRTKKTKEQEWLYQMFGPAPDDSQVSTRDIPWLGDWQQRRKNGYWNTEDGYAYRRLATVIKNNVDANEAIRASAPFIMQDIVRFTKLQTRIDEVFAGQPFLESSSPISSNNKTRFKTYFKFISSVTSYKIKMIHEWMRIHGIDPHNPHQMQDMALLAQLSGQVATAAALTGYTAAGSNQQNLLQPQDQGVTRDAMLLALSWKQKEREFVKKIPDVVLDGDELVEQHIEEKSNGKHKTI